MKSIHPYVSIFLSQKHGADPPPLATPGPNCKGVCQATGISRQLCVWRCFRPFIIGCDQGSITTLLFVWTQADASAAEQQFRQIGNAVPVPLAAALGRAIAKAVVQLWKDEDEERMRVDSPEL